MQLFERERALCEISFTFKMGTVTLKCLLFAEQVFIFTSRDLSFYLEFDGRVSLLWGAKISIFIRTSLMLLLLVALLL